MSDLVELSSYREQKHVLSEENAALVGELAEIAERIYGLAVNTACQGPWRAWSDAQPVGTALEFGDDELAGCGDPRVLALLELSEEVRETMERIAGGRLT